MRRKAAISIIAIAVILCVVALIVLDQFNLLPKRTYTAEHFNIETVISETDYNSNGTDDYLRKNTIPNDVVSLEDLHEDNYPVVEDEWMNHLLLQEDDFNFEQERLANAYAQLPLLRKQILKLLFVRDL